MRTGCFHLCRKTKRKAQPPVIFHIWIQTFFVSVKNLTLPIHLPCLLRYFSLHQKDSQIAKQPAIYHTIPLSIFTAIRLALEISCVQRVRPNHSGCIPIVSSSSVLNDCKVTTGPNISSVSLQSGPGLLPPWFNEIPVRASCSQLYGATPA